MEGSFTWGAKEREVYRRAMQGIQADSLGLYISTLSIQGLWKELPLGTSPSVTVLEVGKAEKQLSIVSNFQIGCSKGRINGRILNMTASVILHLLGLRTSM